MINSTFCGSAFSSGIIISLSKHTAHTHFSFHRTLCFNDASCLIPEIQFCLHTTDNGLESTERLAWGHPSSSTARPVWDTATMSPRGTENHHSFLYRAPGFDRGHSRAAGGCGMLGTVQACPGLHSAVRNGAGGV